MHEKEIKKIDTRNILKLEITTFFFFFLNTLIQYKKTLSKMSIIKTVPEPEN